MDIFVDLFSIADIRAKTLATPAGGLCEFHSNRLWQQGVEVPIGTHVELDPDPQLTGEELANVIGQLRVAGYRLDQIYGAMPCRMPAKPRKDQ